MNTLTKNFWARNFAIALAVHLAISPMWPVAASYAQEAPAEPAPVVEQAPAPEPAPEPTNATEGADGQDGQPTSDVPQDGANGEPQTTTDPATTGENGDSANAPEDPPAATTPAPAEVNTGNASSDTTATNTTNTTNTNILPEGTTYPFGKPPTWYILMCEKSWQPHCDKYIVKPKPVLLETTQTLVQENKGESTAETGENKAQSQDGGASVKTGHADAFGYLISLFNVAVTNSTGSLLFLKNPLSTELDFTDRIMNMFNNLMGEGDGGCSLSGCSLADAVLNIITDQSAEVTNDLVVRAGTGDNSAQSGAGVASVDTGNADAFGGIVNFGNLQIVDSRYMIILMANQGNLDGNIVLPDASFFKSLSTGAKFGPNSSFAGSNTADVTNNGTANALTGTNKASASSTQEQAQIQTGQANSDAVTMNFVNQIGAPVCFIVNVGGTWNGNVVRLPEGFSREKTSYGEIICGAGTNDSSAGVRGVHATTTNYAKVLNNAIVEATTGNNAAAGAAAQIKTGDANAFVQILNVLNQTIIGQDWIFALFTVSGDWKGNLVFGPDPASTSNDLTQVAGQILSSNVSSGGGGGAPGGYTSNPNITIEKSASIVKATAPARVDYKIVVKNNKGGGAVYRAKLADTLKGPDGKRVYARHWVLNTIKDGEEVTVSYTVEYNTGIPYGVYNNTAKLTGFKNESIYVLPEPIDPAMDSVDVSVDEKSDVVAVNDGPQCVPLLQSYMRIGKPVDADDVKDLQKFLNDWEGEALDISGIYDYITVAAVKRFQAKYSAEVLEPWGVTEPTGNVYYTTQRKINDLYCVNGDTFGLTAQQLQEINAFKNGYQSSPSSVPAAAYESVGTNLPKSFPGKALTGKKSGTQVLLRDVNAPAPIFKATSNKKDKNDTVSANQPNWYSLFFPFVDAFEVR